MNKLMMKLLVGSEAIFFISLIMAYLFFWRSGNFESAVTQHLNIRSTGIFTLFLIGSSLSFFLAEKNYRKKNFKGMKIFLSVTICMGIIFLIGQRNEYYKLIMKENVTISQSEFGSSFFALTGFHGLHVVIGLVILSVVLGLSMSGHFKDKPTSVISTVGIYWHFVDVVWIFVFSTIYLLPYVL